MRNRYSLGEKMAATPDRSTGREPDVDRLIEELKTAGNPDHLPGMARYGIDVERAFGVRIPVIRELAGKIRQDHSLALRLWQTGIHEARILAGMIADPDRCTRKFARAWIRDFRSWDLCDQTVMNLLEKCPQAWEWALRWAPRENQWFRRTGFVLMARLAVSDKQAGNRRFDPFFPLIRHCADDDRNLVKKAVNWALRQMGKRNLALHEKCVRLAEELQQRDSPAARWIARDALRELKSDKIVTRLQKKRKV